MQTVRPTVCQPISTVTRISKLYMPITFASRTMLIFLTMVCLATIRRKMASIRLLEFIALTFFETLRLHTTCYEHWYAVPDKADRGPVANVNTGPWVTLPNEI